MRVVAILLPLVGIGVLAVSCLTPEATPTPSPVAMTVSVSPADAGRVEVLPSPGPDGRYRRGANLLLIAIPRPGFQLVSWAGDISGSSNPLNITIESDMSVVANFGASAVGPTSSPWPTSQHEGSGLLRFGDERSLPPAVHSTEKSTVNAETNSTAMNVLTSR